MRRHDWSGFVALGAAIIALVELVYGNGGAALAGFNRSGHRHPRRAGRRRARARRNTRRPRRAAGDALNPASLAVAERSCRAGYGANRRIVQSTVGVQRKLLADHSS